MRDYDNPQYDSGLSFLDTLWNYLLAFALLLVIALVLLRPPVPTEAQVKLKAEFILTMTWPDGALDDIDLWVMLPSGDKVFFRHKEGGFVTLDRDDLGASTDVFMDADGKAQLGRTNREMLTIRAIVPGRYVVAAHVYETRAQYSAFDKTWGAEPALPYEAALTITKLNPRLVEAATAKVALAEKGQEAVFASFEVDANGDIQNVELNPSQYRVVDLERRDGGEEAMR